MARWGLLLPICFRGEADPEACWDRLGCFVNSLLDTTTAEERSMLHVYVGIDQYDSVYD